MRKTWAQCWMGLAWCVGAFVAATGLAEGQQIGHTPIEVRVPQPPSPATALGRTHLVYEVHLTNFGSEVVRVERLDVLGSDGATLASWQGAQLWQRISILGRVHDNSAVQSLAPGSRAIAYLWVSLSAAQSTPGAVAHRLTLSHGTEDRDTLTAAQVPVMEPGPSLAAPVRGGPWLAARGPSNSSPHRLSIVALAGAARVPQRFAVDWALLGEDGRLFHDTPTVLTNWYGYAAPVYAAANGVVALVRDGVPDRIPLDASSAPIMEATEAPGNVIVLDLGHGRFATYAHLKAGSRARRAWRPCRGGTDACSNRQLRQHEGAASALSDQRRRRAIGWRGATFLVRVLHVDRARARACRLAERRAVDTERRTTFSCGHRRDASGGHGRAFRLAASCRCERAQRVSHANGASVAKQRARERLGEFEGRSPSIRRSAPGRARTCDPRLGRVKY